MNKLILAVAWPVAALAACDPDRDRTTSDVDHRARAAETTRDDRADAEREARRLEHQARHLEHVAAEKADVLEVEADLVRERREAELAEDAAERAGARLDDDERRGWFRSDR